MSTALRYYGHRTGSRTSEPALSSLDVKIFEVSCEVELSALLRRLALPVYVPTVLYSGGAAAIVPVVPLVGLRLGMTVPQVATLGTLAGVLAVIGPLPTGRIVHSLGERAALIVGALVAIASIVGCLVAVTATSGTWRPGCSPRHLVMAVGDLTWTRTPDLPADEVPPHLRAR